MPDDTSSDPDHDTMDEDDRCQYCGAWPNEECSPHCGEHLEPDDEAYIPDVPGRW